MTVQQPLTTSLAFQLGKLGQLATARFARKIAPLGLRPRHCGVLDLLQDEQTSQLAIANTLGVSNSVVVNMLDELEEIGAVRRAREPADRRRHRVELTEHGIELSRKATALAHQVDKELLADLSDAQAASLRRTIGALALTQGVPG